MSVATRSALCPEQLIEGRTTKDHTEILRGHEIHFGVLRHSVQVEHERPEGIVVILWQLFNRKPHGRILVLCILDTYPSAVYRTN
jgi:hypothetical protein